MLVEHSKTSLLVRLWMGKFRMGFHILDDLIYYKGRIYVVPESKFKENVLRTFNDSPLSGHQGFLKTYIQIRERFAWKGLKEDVMHYVRECTTCQQNKVEHTHPIGFLQLLLIDKHLSFQNNCATNCLGWTFHPTIDLFSYISEGSHP
jgi:hypothetical protein